MITIPSDGVFFQADVWRPAMEKFAEATHLTVVVYDADEQVVCGPIQSTPLFKVLRLHAYDPGLVSDCARRCLTQTDIRPAVVLASAYGLAVVGTSFLVDDRIVGAAVGAYAFVDFCQRSEIERLARVAGVPFGELWEIARLAQPLPERRLRLHGELLQVLGDSLLRELHRTQQHERRMQEVNEELERRVADRTMELVATNTALRVEVRQREHAETEATRLLGQLAIVQEDERTRIAHDLHDVLGQHLTALRLSLEMSQTHAGDVMAVQRHVARAVAIASRLDDEIEFLAWQLRPSSFEAGVVAAIETHAREWSRHFEMPIDFRTSGLTDVRLLPDVEISLYRIAQETLNNIAKHAKAARVALIVERRDQYAVLVIQDDGDGFDVRHTLGAPTERRLGLIGMHERAAQAGGLVDIESEPTKGTRVTVRIPIPAPDEDSAIRRSQT